MSLVRIALALLVSITTSATASAQTKLSKDSHPGIIAVGSPSSIRSFTADSKPWAAAEIIANDIGLSGRWIVTSSVKDGEFSNAQIGQEPGDVITTQHAGPQGVTEVQVS